MSSKKKQNKAAAASKKDDDLDFLNEAISANSAAAATAPLPVPPPVNEAEEDDEENDDTGASSSKKDNKKKKKKKAAPKEKELSAAGKAILLRQQQQAEEDNRRKEIEEEEERKFQEELAKEEEEKQRAKEARDKKAQAKKDKVEAQKAAGTYMTKAEKEKKAKQQARLEMLKSSSGISVGSSAPKKEPKKKVEVVEKKEEVVVPVVEAVVEVPVVEAAAPADESDDDWDTAVDLLSTHVDSTSIAATGSGNADEEEDILAIEARAQEERYRELGKERARKEEEARLKRELEDQQRADMERKEREAAMKKIQSRKNREAKAAAAKAARTESSLRSPISCIMGHVDTGKTKLLDKIRNTSVQDGEAGGITQQIGATQFSRETLQAQTECLKTDTPFNIDVPGLLMIDTPGHEAFSNLRNRGSSVCDFAVLVIDMMHGLEQQTIESLNMLKARKCPFIVALNKVDRCYGWKTDPGKNIRPIREALAAQDENCLLEFEDRVTRTIVAIMEQGLNAKLYWENDDLAHTVSLVPTSAHFGEGIPDLLQMLLTLTQSRLTDQLMFMDSVQCTVLEVKVIEGLGNTIDVILVHGTLKVGDTVVFSTLDGPVVTVIKALLTPPPNREMRVKSEYIHHERISGSIGIKIVAPDTQKVIAGTPMLVVDPEDDVEDVKEDVQSDLSGIMTALSTDAKGVMVHASTLGALEALLQFLHHECKPPIPVGHIAVGPIHKRDVMKANIQNERGNPEFATILAFDVPADNDAKIMAEEENVRIFYADIIYHLFDQFSKYMDGITQARREEAKSVAVFPCVLKIMPQHIFNKKDPIIMGVEVIEGTLRLHTPLHVPSLSLDVGRVVSIENNHKEVASAKKGMTVAIKIAAENEASSCTYGRQFDHTNSLYSRITRPSIQSLKEFFKDDVSNDEWRLLIRLKTVFNIS